MSDWMVQEFTELYKRVKWPEDTRTTAEQRVLFDQGIDVTNSFRGHPDTLVEALKLFVGSGSRPYAFAGAGYVMGSASYLKGGDYDQHGLETALSWLAKAQEIAPNTPEIDVIEAVIYLQMKRLDNTRKILDHVAGQGTPNYHLCVTYMSYWDSKKDIPQMEHWHKRALEQADTDTRRVFAMTALASAYMMNKMSDKAIEGFKHVLQLNPTDPWAWHNISYMLTHKGQYKEAYFHNQKALGLMDFGVAREIEKYLKTKLGIKDKNAATQKESKNWFKKLFGG